MLTLCPNCSAPIVFDPKTQRVVCHTCGSSFDPQEMNLSKENVDLEQTDPDHPEDIEDKEVAAHFLDCYVYHCPSCGGEIMVNGQTGKVVGGIPWRKKLVTRATWILTAIFTFILASGVSWLLLAWKNSREGLDPEAVMGLIVMLLALGGFVNHLANGKRKLMNIHLKLSQASSIFHFTKKRQG